MPNPSKESQNEAWQLQKQDWLETARRLDELKAERDTVQGQFEALGEAYMDQERERDRLVAALNDVVCEYKALRMDLALETTPVLEAASDALLADCYEEPTR